MECPPATWPSNAKKPAIYESALPCQRNFELFFLSISVHSDSPSTTAGLTLGLPTGGRQRPKQPGSALASTRASVTGRSAPRHFSSVVLAGPPALRITNVVPASCSSYLPTRDLHLVVSFVSSAHFARSALSSEAIYPPSIAVRLNVE